LSEPTPLFRTGTKVRLKTGLGPVMLAAGMNGSRVYCMWFDSQDQLHEYAIPLELLQEARTHDTRG